MTDLVVIHDCIKDGDVVHIRATVHETRYGKIVRLTAHSESCKVMKTYLKRKEKEASK